MDDLWVPKKFQELSPCPFSGLVPVIELRFRIFGRVWPWSLVDLLGKSDEDVPAELFEFFRCCCSGKWISWECFCFFVDVFVAGGKGAALRVEVVLPQIWVKCYIDVNDRTRVDVYF